MENSHMRRVLVICLVGVLCLIGFVEMAHSAAADFTFHVPVEIANLPPDITQGEVYCNICFGSLVQEPLGMACPMNEVMPIPIIKTFAIAGGRYTGTLDISVSHSRRAEVKSWQCTLFVQKNGARKRISQVLPASGEHSLDASKPLREQVYGSIQQ